MKLLMLPVVMKLRVRKMKETMIIMIIMIMRSSLRPVMMTNKRLQV